MATAQTQAGPPVKKKSIRKKVTLSMIGGVAASLVIGAQTSTQYFAHHFNFNPHLGGSLGGWYFPWKILSWEVWKPQYPAAWNKAVGFGYMATLAGIIATFILFIAWQNTARANNALHGTARWATRKDIVTCGLLAAEKKMSRTEKIFSFFRRITNYLKGKDAVVAQSTSTNGSIAPVKSAKVTKCDSVYVGAWQDDAGKIHYLRHSGPEHILCYAPTRSGKGVGLVIPTLLSWTESAVVADLKGELWAMTSGWRNKYAGNRVIKFEPADPQSSAAWNPVEEVRFNTFAETGDAQNLALMLVDPDGKGIQGDHWKSTAYNLLTGMILYAGYKSKAEGTKASLASIDAVLSDKDTPIAALWEKMMKNTYAQDSDGRPTAHVKIAMVGRDMADTPEKEAGSILSTAKTALSLYRDPVVERNTDHCDFRIRDLMHHDDPVTLYIVTQPNDKARLRPIVRIMINMILRLLADKTNLTFEGGQPKALYKHRLLMMMDEFPSLGKLEIMQESLAFVAGYGLKCYLICQDLTQLTSSETGYGKDEAITSNCHIQNAYPPNRIETAEHLSKVCGQTTIVDRQTSMSGGRFKPLLSQVSVNMQSIQRPLLTADECMRMRGPQKDSAGKIVEGGDMLIYVAGFPAIYGKQILYFKDPVFLARASVPAPDVQQ